MSRPAWTLTALFALLCAVQLAARTAYGVALHDQAEMVLFAQDLRWAYDEQVPLYAWLASGLLRATGWTVWTLDLLKLALVGAMLAGLYAAGRALSGGPLGGLIAALAAFTLPTLYDDVLREATHSTAVLAMAALSWAVIFRPARSPLALGLAWGGGLLAKPNMLIVMASQRPALRRSSRAFVALLVAVVVATSGYAVLAVHLTEVQAGTAEFRTEGGGGGRWRGLGDLAGSVPAEGALLFALAGFAWWRLRRAGQGVTPPERAALLSLPIGVLAYALIVVAFDVGTVRDRWLAPSLLAVCPPAGAWLVRAGGRTPPRAAAALCVLFALLVFYRATQPLTDGGAGQGAMAARPYVALADEAADAAARAGTDALVFADDQLAATTKLRHPALRVFGTKTCPRVPPSRVLVVGEAEPPGRCGPPEPVSRPYRFGNPNTYRTSWRVCAPR